MKFLSTKTVCERYDISRVTLYRWKEKKGFPSPVMTGNGETNRYRLSDIEAWEEANFKAAA